MQNDNIKRWLELAKQFQQGQFWDSVFDSDYTEQMMKQFSATDGTAKSASSFPRADVLLGMREMLIRVDLPGVRKEDVELSVSDNSVVVKGVVHPFAQNMKIVQTERHAGEFERAISLPESIAPQGKITARFENGLLEIRIPRVQRPREEIKID